MSVAALFVRADSIYKTMTGVDAWDAERDALRWQGGRPVVAHPPCRLWGRLAFFSSAPPEEADLARFAVAAVRVNGGVLEHPAGSRLWRDQSLPLPGEPADEFGGLSVALLQSDFGHRADKPTWLYIVGAKRPPQWQRGLLPATHVIETRKKEGRRPAVSKREREATPPEFARWLVRLASRCRMP